MTHGTSGGGAKGVRGEWEGACQCLGGRLPAGEPCTVSCSVGPATLRHALLTHSPPCVFCAAGMAGNLNHMPPTNCSPSASPLLPSPPPADLAATSSCLLLPARICLLVDMLPLLQAVPEIPTIVVGRCRRCCRQTCGGGSSSSRQRSRSRMLASGEARSSSRRRRHAACSNGARSSSRKRGATQAVQCWRSCRPTARRRRCRPSCRAGLRARDLRRRPGVLRRRCQAAAAASWRRPGKR